jgi:hypothetical protein
MDAEKYLLIDLTWSQTQELQRILDFSDELVIVVLVIYLLAVQLNYTTPPSNCTLRRNWQMISDEKSHTTGQSHQSWTLLFSHSSHLCNVHYRLLNTTTILC